jgi:hypothetical protein
MFIFAGHTLRGAQNIGKKASPTYTEHRTTHENEDMNPVTAVSQRLFHFEM